MRRAELILSCIVAAGCGRIDFPANARDAAHLADTAPGTLPSCVALAPTCGPTASASCCASPLVPGGTFYRGYDVAGDGMYPAMTAPATVSDFRLDQYPITVGRFRAFVAGGMGTQQNPPATGAGARALNGSLAQGGWDAAWNTSLPADTAALIAMLDCGPPYRSWTDAPGAAENLPIDCVTWYEAMAFCSWDGGFLPTEAEWNYAASGGTDQRAYPWSTPASSVAIDCSYTDYDAASGYCVNPGTGAMNRVGSESPKGDSKWGQADLSGNVWNWTLDFDGGGYPNPCSDCANLSPAANRVFRGGDFHALYSELRSAHRASDVPTAQYLGVRCARAAQ